MSRKIKSGIKRWFSAEDIYLDEFTSENVHRTEKDEIYVSRKNTPMKDPEAYRSVLGSKKIRRLYSVFAVLFCIAIITFMIITVSFLPRIGSAENAAVNEVMERYIEKGVEETGAVNFVAGMILDYRAFDTFGESCVLFTAAACVFILLRAERDDDHPNAVQLQEDDRYFEPKNDEILKYTARVAIPFMFIFGIYIVLNGHLSPGGGFSGGAVLGTGLVLYLLAFGFEKTERFFTAKTYKAVTTTALCFYCLAKSYSFFTGANGLESGIPLGIPGNILSSGLILPLNICVGAVVACTIYAFYVMFRKGGF